MRTLHLLPGLRPPAHARAVLLAVAVVFGGAAPLSAQPAFTVSIGRMLHALSPGGDAAARRQTTDASVEAEHQLAGERVRLFYEMDAGTFTTEGDWHYALHSGGATFRFPLGSSDRTRLFVTASGAWRVNGADWMAADYRAVELRANVETRLRPTTILRFGYRLDGRAFPELPELDQVEHDLFFSLLANLPSRTTIIGEVHAGAKTYATGTLAASPTPSTGILAQDVAGRGRRMGPRLRTAGYTAAPATAPAAGERAGQITWLARVAQSLTDRTGAAIQVLQRTGFDAVPRVLVTTPALFFDDGVYDDPFASDARVVTAMAKRQFERGIVLEGHASLTAKDYRGAAPLNGEGLARDGELRTDRIVSAGLGATFPLVQPETGRLAVHLNVEAFLVRHRSNDAFYNYTSRGVGIGAAVSY